ncbi:MAG: helix-turn-helix domain-containing protein [Frankiaceae bacterium]|jgi:transcriptional regulator GlxA family with amidase domain
MPLNVAVALIDNVAAFELGVACEVFGIDRSAQGVPAYDFAVVSVTRRPLRSAFGFTVSTPYGLDRLAAADLVVVPGSGTPGTEAGPRALHAALRDTVARGGRVMSLCGGVFVLAAAGLLDGRRAAAHWYHAAELAARYPAVDVDPTVLYVEDGPVLTSAGTAAAIDLCLHVVRQDHGPAIANVVARRMVVPPQRDGGQAQYVEAPVPVHDEDHVLADVLDWAVQRLDEPLPVTRLAARATMAPRTFVRHFAELTGTTPHRWLIEQRLLCAERLLEEDLPIEEVARRAGFGTAAALREQFGRRRGVTPQAYRRSFAAR